MLSAASEGSSSQTVPDAHTRQGRDVEERFVERERGSNGSALLINVGHDNTTCESLLLMSVVFGGSYSQ